MLSLKGRRSVRDGGRRRGRVKSFVAVSAALVVLIALVGMFTSASAVAPASRLEVNVMNEPVRGGEPELAVNPLHPQDVVFGHTVVGNSYTNNGAGAGEEAVDGGLQV